MARVRTAATLLAAVGDAEMRERVQAGFREKYGFLDSRGGVFRGGDAVIMRLVPR